MQLLETDRLLGALKNYKGRHDGLRELFSIFCGQVKTFISDSAQEPLGAKADITDGRQAVTVYFAGHSIEFRFDQRMGKNAVMGLVRVIVNGEFRQELAFNGIGSMEVSGKDDDLTLHEDAARHLVVHYLAEAAGLVNKSATREGPA